MNMPERNPSGSIRKLTLPDGFQVGILNLDTILQEVYELNLTDKQSIVSELIERVKACNYVATGAEKEYASALIHEYRKEFFPEEISHRIDPKKPQSG